MGIERVHDRDRAMTLVAAGGHVERHSVVMCRDLAEPLVPRSPPHGFRIAALDEGRTAEYGALLGRAYPPDHPDHEPADVDPTSAAATVARYLRGEEVGPWIPGGSRHVTDPDDRIVGAIVINQTVGDSALGVGPLVTDLVVDPDARGRGLGTTLLEASAARLAALGWGRLALVVTVGNPAQRVYERSGFRVTSEQWRIRTGG